MLFLRALRTKSVFRATTFPEKPHINILIYKDICTNNIHEKKSLQKPDKKVENVYGVHPPLQILLEKRAPAVSDRIIFLIFFAHCLRSLSSVRCGVEKSLRTTNETIFLAHINPSVGSAWQNALCSANNATKAETAAIRRLSSTITDRLRQAR